MRRQLSHGSLKATTCKFSFEDTSEAVPDRGAGRRLGHRRPGPASAPHGPHAAPRPRPPFARLGRPRETLSPGARGPPQEGYTGTLRRPPVRSCAAPPAFPPSSIQRPGQRRVPTAASAGPRRAALRVLPGLLATGDAASFATGRGRGAEGAALRERVWIAQHLLASRRARGTGRAGTRLARRVCARARVGATRGRRSALSPRARPVRTAVPGPCLGLIPLGFPSSAAL